MSIGNALLAAMGDQRSMGAANRLCQACVGLLDVDAAAISLVHGGVNIATLGASDATARLYDELQFTLGEGPCLTAVARRAPVVMVDLAHPPGGVSPWPVFGDALLARNVRGVCAMPIIVAGDYVGAFEVFHREPTEWTMDQVIGMAEAAELAQMPVLDLLSGDLLAASTDPRSDAWAELTALTRAEVSQATGVLMAQLNLTAATALARLRGHAYATGRSASSVARDIITHRLKMEPH